MKKQIVIPVAIVAALGLSFPLVNLAVGSGKGVKLGNADKGGASYQTAMALLAQKCGDCHTNTGHMPFYANLPIAEGMIAEHLEEAREHFDMGALLSKTPGAPATEVGLARIDHSIRSGTMPPPSYTMMHWDARLGADDAKSIDAWIAEERATHHADAGISEELRGALLRPIPKAPKLDPAKVALGRTLYHDARLSKDDSISCASCHDLQKAGTDLARFSTGVDGQVGGINSPTVFNAALQLAQFWDGRAADLQAQADGPPNNPIEMASNWPEIIGKLDLDEQLKAAFVAVYPDGFSATAITDAIAAFEKTLLTPDSDFDRYLAGDEGALTTEAKLGHSLFVRSGCATCHVGELLGGRSYEKMGVRHDYFADRANPTEADKGRLAVTKNPVDEHHFKVPMLRNVELTPPYFHDGTVTTLQDAVEKMAHYQRGITLSDKETGQLVAFMKSLTGTWDGKKLAAQ